MNPVPLGAAMSGFLTVVLLVAGPIVAAALLAGVVVGLAQAVTQVQDQSIAYGVKIAVVVVLLMVMGRWMGGKMLEQFDYAFQMIPNMAFHNVDAREAGR
jgi:type III secretory pathway component EscS